MDMMLNKLRVGFWKNKKLTEETKRKISLSCKGRVAWNKGKSCPYLYGHTHGFKKGELPFMFGKKHLELSKLKNRIAHLGKTTWNKGKELSDKHKNNLSISHKGLHNSPETQFKKGIIPWNKKDKIEICCKNCNKLFYVINSRRYKARYCSMSCRNKVSTLENKVISIIDKYNLPYKFVGNGNFKIEKKIPDFININGAKIAVEVYCKEDKEYRKRIPIEQWISERTAIFNRYGWELKFIEKRNINEKEVLEVMKCQ